MQASVNTKELVKDFDRYLKNNKEEKSSFNDDFEKYLKTECMKTAFNGLDIETFDWYKKVLGLIDSSIEKELNEVYEIDSNIKKLGAEIRRLRQAQGWSTHKLAELSQISLGFINQLENGKASMPKASNLTKLAKIFNVNPDRFLYLAGYIKNEPAIDFDWKISIKNQLSNIGINSNYINEIIDYIETVQIKQERQEQRGE